MNSCLGMTIGRHGLEDIKTFYSSLVIKQCGRILVLDKGKIIEDGTYDELIQRGGFFAELVAGQRVDNMAELRA